MASTADNFVALRRRRDQPDAQLSRRSATVPPVGLSVVATCPPRPLPAGVRAIRSTPGAGAPAPPSRGRAAAQLAQLSDPSSQWRCLRRRETEATHRPTLTATPRNEARRPEARGATRRRAPSRRSEGAATLGDMTLNGADSAPPRRRSTRAPRLPTRLPREARPAQEHHRAPRSRRRVATSRRAAAASDRAGALRRRPPATVKRRRPQRQALLSRNVKSRGRTPGILRGSGRGVRGRQCASALREERICRGASSSTL